MPMTTSIGFDRQISRPALSISSRKSRRRNRALKHSRRQRRLLCGEAKQSRASASSKSVAERLAMLRSLIPPKTGAAATAGDRLFEETAEYILILRTQVEVLKKLVDVYSPCEGKNGGWA